MFLLIALLTGCDNLPEMNQPGALVPLTADQDSSIPAVTINGARIHTEAFGPVDGPLLVVLHGGPGADYRYLLNCKAFANAGYRVIFYDQRGTGLSERFPKSIYTLQLQYDDLSAVIEHYRSTPNQNVFLLGHSWGAMLASAYIDKYPNAIQGAILAEPGGLVWSDVEVYLERSQKIKLFDEYLNDATYFDQFVTGTADEHALLDYKLSINSSTGVDNVGNEGEVPFWRPGAVTFSAYIDIGEDEKPDWTTNLKTYTPDVLFLYSENNKAYGESHARKVSSAYPNVTLFQVNDAGHDMLTFPKGWSNAYPVILSYLNTLN